MIYLDHNATNPPDPRVLEAYRRGLELGWANPSSQHAEGRRARAMLEEAREQVAALFGVAPGQVTFTSSGTEALNQALWSVARTGTAEGSAPRVLASAVEHPSVLEALDRLEAEGQLRGERVAVDDSARLRTDDLAERLQRGPRPALLALLAAQNEVGTLQPLAEAGALAAAVEVPLLVDATQAAGRVPWDWAAGPWDYLVVSGHKLRAPRGAAALVHRGRAPEPRPLLLGGSQERGRRAGTEDVPAIVALGAACALVARGELTAPDELLARREAFEAALAAAVPGLRVLAAAAPRLPQTSLVLVPGGDGEALLAGLDLGGVAASTGSACASGARTRSHVLAAMGIDEAAARGRLRFSFGPETTTEELARAAELLGALVAQQR
ncbi:MAG: cysteine desulfurase family protein [Planctomycetota bacterium]